MNTKESFTDTDAVNYVPLDPYRFHLWFVLKQNIETLCALFELIRSGRMRREARGFRKGDRERIIKAIDDIRFLKSALSEVETIFIRLLIKHGRMERERLLHPIDETDDSEKEE